MKTKDSDNEYEERERDRERERRQEIWRVTRGQGMNERTNGMNES